MVVCDGWMKEDSEGVVGMVIGLWGGVGGEGRANKWVREGESYG